MDKVRKNKTAIFVFLFPSALLFLAIIILPIFMSGYYSLLDWDGITSGTFVGIQNYIELFTEKSLGFGPTVRNAFIFAGLSVFLQLPLALLLALTLAKGIKGERFFVAVFFIPVLLSTTVIGQLWMKIYNPQYGIVNSFLHAVGLDTWCKTWLGDQNMLLPPASSRCFGNTSATTCSSCTQALKVCHRISVKQLRLTVPMTTNYHVISQFL